MGTNSSKEKNKHKNKISQKIAKKKPKNKKRKKKQSRNTKHKEKIDKKQEQTKELNPNAPPPPNLGPPKIKVSAVPPKKIKRKNERRSKRKKNRMVEIEGELPMMRLKCIEGQPDHLKPNTGRWNALTISDCHFNDHNDSWHDVNKIPGTLKKLQEVIEEEQIDQLILLGDIFHSTCKNTEYVVEMITKIADMAPSLYIIGGNHDRGKTVRLKKQLPKELLKKKVHICDQYFMLLTPSNLQEKEIDTLGSKSIEEKSFERILLSHDAGNNYKLWDEKIIWFHRAIKYFHKWIKKSDLLITGHTHANKFVFEENMGSVGCFHISNFHCSAGRITESESGGSLKFKLKQYYL
ncbi:transmembrane protein with metallophosphoesterase domain-related [Anaeramoeba flamelloides]|uniref:Transmembrane protein with metallophosphoesterase domain-related n=1 Tax=Anaeramoeba flamelloides TaxID=1746091 RepID=A0ABQ8XN44_9EUKA|nr:transmembrane protein with metallophosphoesterase domain-related [Anaeramoeba flamelloides]